MDINTQYALAAGEGDSRKAENLYGILHDVGTPNGKARNVAIFEKRTFNNAYVTHAVGAEGIFQIGTPGYVSWGALDANPYAPFQIELENTDNQADFEKGYANYIALAREMADKYGIPKTLDVGGAGTPGLKTHKWVSDNIGGDHQDPYAYLASHGISKEQFARDLANGINGAVTTASVTQSAPSTPQASSGTWTDDDGTVVTLENGVFRPDRKLTDWYYPGYKPTGAIFNAGSSITYKGYTTANGYVYVAYNGYGSDAGRTCYVACRDANTHEPLGTFE